MKYITLYREDYTQEGWEEIKKNCEVTSECKEITIKFGSVVFK